MQTAVIHPFPLSDDALLRLANNNLAARRPQSKREIPQQIHPVRQEKQEPRTVCMMPGNIAEIAPGLEMAIDYKITKTGHQVILKFWAGGQRTKDYVLHDNVFDLSNTFQCEIRRFGTTMAPGTNHPIKTMFAIEQRIPA